MVRLALPAGRLLLLAAAAAAFLPLLGGCAGKSLRAEWDGWLQRRGQQQQQQHSHPGPFAPRSPVLCALFPHHQPQAHAETWAASTFFVFAVEESQAAGDPWRSGPAGFLLADRTHTNSIAGFLVGPSSSSSSHSLRFFYTLMSDPGQGQPEFIGEGYLDDQLFARYDSVTKRALPRVPWIEAIEREHTHFWEQNTRRALNSELRFRGDLVTLQNHHNQSGGSHTWQRMYGCELRADGRRGGYMQYGYDGADYISLDKETLTWTAASAMAQVFKRKREANLAYSQHLKAYLEEECVEWLQTFLAYGKEALRRREPPAVTVGRTERYDSRETLVCRAHGFYPKEISVAWKKDGDAWVQETLRGGVVPNSDRTYHTWASTQIDPKDRSRYRCHVDHAGLPKPLVLAWEEPASSRWGLIAGVVLVALAAVALVVTGAILCTRQQRLFPHGQGPDAGRGQEVPENLVGLHNWRISSYLRGPLPEPGEGGLPMPMKPEAYTEGPAEPLAR
ncbi:major histocompatibility complex class I-related gene protein-like [Elgaria multicarinata webbii]|uniref:major histocompatibility complex class I-related gene protein-like n=1 Tax=Elgaria multicarinata webbii TaxID=159646 RepID=UPI002FCD061B